MKKVKRIWNVFTKEGLKTFGYLVKTNLQAKKSADNKYKRWRKVQEGKQGQSLPVDRQPFFSVIIMHMENNANDVVSDVDVRQEYDNFEIIGCGHQETLAEVLERAKGEYIGFLQKGDVLSEQALMRMASAMEEMTGEDVLLLYSDEDQITEAGKRKNPFFKPDYSPDTLRSFFYMGGFLVMKKDFLQRFVYCIQKPLRFAGYLMALEASFLIKDGQVCHIPEVLYHRKECCERPDTELLAAEKKQLFACYGTEIETELVADCGEVRVLYTMKTFPKVSIVIPSKDNPSMLKVCLDSIASYTRYPDYEIIVIDNGSSEENRSRYEVMCREQKVECRYVYEPMEFNFSRMCNQGAGYAKGKYYLFLNDDIEICRQEGADWLTRLMGQAVQPHTGVTGAKLLYPDSKRIQHIGVVNYESGAAHILSGADDEVVQLFGRNRLDYDYSIVTGACFLVMKDKFHEIGGFATNLAVTFNDVELCFRLLKKGYYNVVRTDVVLYHHESVSRGEDAIVPEKYYRHLKEREKLFDMHPEFVKRDRFYSHNLTQTELDGAPNIEKRPETFSMEYRQKGSGENPVLPEENENLTCIIEAVQADRRVCIRGFAFSEGIRYNNLTKTYLWLEGEKETVRTGTVRLYNPTIAPQMRSRRNLNFVEFYTSIPASALHEKEYRIGVELATRPGRKKLCLMTDRKLENGRGKKECKCQRETEKEH